jgi:hypothetical protein
MKNEEIDYFSLILPKCGQKNKEEGCRSSFFCVTL